MMDTYPDTFAFIQVHHGDSFTQSWAYARGNFYTDFDAYPTSYFDGTIRRRGAYTFTTYQSDYNTRRGVATDVTIELAGLPLGGQDYRIQTTVCIEAGGTGKTMRIYRAQVLDHWPVAADGGVSYSRNGLKQTANTHGSEPDITLAAGTCQVLENDFTFDARSWSAQDDITIIAWAQEAESSSSPTDRAEVYQAAIMKWPFPAPGPPINDDCENASAVGDGTFTGKTEEATNDGTATCGDSNTNGDVWYSYYVREDGTLHVDTCGSDYDTVVSVLDGCPGTGETELGCNDDSDDCGAGSVQSSLDVAVTLGSTYLIRVSGSDDAFGSYALNVSGPADTTSPSPDPMAFSSPPAATEDFWKLDMSAVEATDLGTPPVEYQFEADGGMGSSAWQSSRDYTASGLNANTPYTFRVRARDSAPTPNETALSDPATAYTAALTPNPPLVSNMLPNGMDVDVDGVVNPSYTEYAIQCASTSPYDANWDGMYIGASGLPSATAVWLTDAAWDVQSLTGLICSTQYCWQVMARNGDLVETVFGDQTCESTVPTDVASFGSCRTHGAAGEVCLELGIGSGSRATGDNVDPRAGSVRKLVFEVNAPVTDVQASVDCANYTYSGTATETVEGGTTVTVDLDPVLPLNDCCTITLSGDVEDERSVATLMGDVNTDMDVTALDYSFVKLRLGQPIDESTARADVNADGDITSLDYSSIKLNLGANLVSCP